MKLYIKNMVCARCKMVVKTELEKLGLHPISVDLGEIELAESSLEDKKVLLITNLQLLGFDLIDDKKSRTIERIKNLITNLVQNKHGGLQTTLSDYLAKELNQDYSALSNLFSEVENSTIEKYFILQKVEKIKELICYDELSLSEIADLLNYSSVAYLSNQFKRVTGFAPSYFKQLKHSKRKHLEDL